MNHKYFNGICFSIELNITLNKIFKTKLKSLQDECVQKIMTNKLPLICGSVGIVDVLVLIIEQIGPPAVNIGGETILGAKETGEFLPFGDGVLL